MNRYLLTLLILPIFAATAHAQSWGDQQKAYHDRMSAEVEAFHQREDMERMRQEHERDMQEQQREIEQQRYELERMRDDQSDPPPINRSTFRVTSERLWNRILMGDKDGAEAL